MSVAIGDGWLGELAKYLPPNYRRVVINIVHSDPIQLYYECYDDANAVMGRGMLIHGANMEEIVGDGGDATAM